MAVYTRQSSSGIVDGGVIEASDLNAEFDQLASAFLQPTFGTGAAGTDIAVTFDGETNDGIFTAVIITLSAYYFDYLIEIRMLQIRRKSWT